MNRFVVLAVLMLVAGPTLAQTASGDQPKPQQPAPPYAPHSSSHDAQSGNPGTAPEPPANQNAGSRQQVEQDNKAIAEEAKKQKK